jgi:hypothetical protein
MLDFWQNGYRPRYYSDTVRGRAAALEHGYQYARWSANARPTGKTRKTRINKEETGRTMKPYEEWKQMVETERQQGGTRGVLGRVFQKRDGSLPRDPAGIDGRLSGTQQALAEKIRHDDGGIRRLLTARTRALRTRSISTRGRRRPA